jgi:hypothetical protein
MLREFALNADEPNLRMAFVGTSQRETGDERQHRGDIPTLGVALEALAGERDGR